MQPSVEDWIPISSKLVRLPLELVPPPGFVAEDPGTWPKVEGRLEYHTGRIWYMPPCGERQGDVSSDAHLVVAQWARRQGGFRTRTNEPGIYLGGEVRGADVAVWRSADASRGSAGFARTAPVLAVEVEGQEEDEAALRVKAQWYLGRGVEVVWLVLASSREVVVLTTAAESRHAAGERLPPQPGLPGLEPAVDAFFEQLAD